MNNYKLNIAIAAREKSNIKGFSLLLWQKRAFNLKQSIWPSNQTFKEFYHLNNLAQL